MGLEGMIEFIVLYGFDDKHYFVSTISSMHHQTSAWMSAILASMLAQLVPVVANMSAASTSLSRGSKLDLGRRI